MAYLEKHRNGVYVVCRAERKIPVIFEPAPQLNANSRQLVGWSLGWIRWNLLTCRTSGWYIEPICNTTKDEFKYSL